MGKERKTERKRAEEIERERELVRVVSVLFVTGYMKANTSRNLGREKGERKWRVQMRSSSARSD